MVFVTRWLYQHWLLYDKRIYNLLIIMYLFVKYFPNKVSRLVIIKISVPPHAHTSAWCVGYHYPHSGTGFSLQCKIILGKIFDIVLYVTRRVGIYWLEKNWLWRAAILTLLVYYKIQTQRAQNFLRTIWKTKYMM